ncbi:MAG: hypothetical protein ACXV3S_08955 [Kineosporiaceae bacterium]
MNVGRNKRVGMSALRQALADAGYEQVSSPRSPRPPNR